MKNKTILLACMAGGLFLLSGCGTPTINLADYTEITASGYDGYGTITATIDGDAITEDYGKKVEIAEGEIYDDATQLGDIITDWAYAAADSSGSLSNGDTVTISIEAESEVLAQYVNADIVCSDISYTVEGLEEIAETDVFAGVEVNFSGVAPKGSASLVSDAAYEQYGTYSIDPYSGLSNGDTVFVTYTMYDQEEFIEGVGAVPAETTKTYTVSGLDSYVASADDISAEYVAEMEEEAFDAIEAKIAQLGDTSMYSYIANSYDLSPDFTYGDYGIECGYLLSIKDADYLWGDDYTKYILFISVPYNLTVHDGTESNGVAYFAAVFPDLLLEEDGEVTGISSVSVSAPKTSTDALYTEYISQNKDSYNITELDATLAEIKE